MDGWMDGWCVCVCVCVCMSMCVCGINPIITTKLLFSMYVPIFNFKSFSFSGVPGFPQGLKQIHQDCEMGSVTFGWNKIDCEQTNCVLLGYEVRLYYDEGTHTERMNESVTTYSVLPQQKPKVSLPKAISVAAVNELGVGDHSPPVKIKPFG